MKYDCVVYGHFTFECTVEADSKDEAEELADRAAFCNVNLMKVDITLTEVKPIEEPKEIK